MSPEEVEQIRQWIACRRRAAPLLERIKRQELRRLTDDEQCQAMEDVLELAELDDSPTDSSGFVEMQRKLQKLRQRGA
jgi:hypothetical protein